MITLDGDKVTIPRIEALLRRIDRSGDCWRWTGPTNARGYGKASFGGVGWFTHRLTYELFVGPIPEGLQIDHLCRVRDCCNPEHLEPVTAKENSDRIPAHKNLTPGSGRKCRCPRCQGDRYLASLSRA